MPAQVTPPTPHPTSLAIEPPLAGEAAACVYFDGGCPLCSREIAAYRNARGGERLRWVDAQACADPELGPALPRDAALRRLHVRLPDGRLVSGAAAFVAIWQHLPAFRGLARLARVPGALGLMEGLYRAFLGLRRLWRTAPAPTPPAGTWASWPVALRRDLRTDHAGEAGAVMIYRGVLAMARDPALRAFAQQHLHTEMRHLELIEAVVPRAGRSRLLPLWRLAGWLTGALPACLGPRAVYLTVEAVETFVDRHYAAQLARIDTLRPAAPAALPASLDELRALLATCRRDEQAHRDDARARRGVSPRGGPAAWLGAGWAAVVAAGSGAAVRLSRWF